MNLEQALRYIVSFGTFLPESTDQPLKNSGPGISMDGSK
jgi:hypothetical protein